MSKNQQKKEPRRSSGTSERSASTSGSIRSRRSDRSKFDPPDFSLETEKRSESSSGSSVSPRSDRSKFDPPDFGPETPGRSVGTARSSQSFKSDRSKFDPPDFSDEKPKRSETTAFLKSDRSRFDPPDFSLAEPQRELKSCPGCGEALEDPVLSLCGHWACRGCADQSASSGGSSCQTCGKRFKRTTDGPLKPKKKLAEFMKGKFETTLEGDGRDRCSLKSIFTTLFITTHKPEELTEEHELTPLKYVRKRLMSNSVHLDNIFNREEHHRTVLTNGVAGIGKSFSVQKFILDWAEEEAYGDVEFVFLLSFRELHVCKGEKSLVQLLTDFHPTLTLKDLANLSETKTVVVLDGLDESRLQLDFVGSKKVLSADEKTSVDNLVVSLIKGDLLPRARIWITSRPAAASQIPSNYIDMSTEIKGFRDSQKAEYFRRRFISDPGLADRVISHIQSSHSLDMMCQIPIFCWISAILLQEVFGGDEETEIPQTLTEMMAHFLLVQTRRGCRDCDHTTKWTKEEVLKTHREFLLKLGKLAFVHLKENNLIFYEQDLKDCGIDLGETSVYSGFCNTVLRKEEIIFQNKVFFFVHLTIQEFFAAVYVYECFATNFTEDLNEFLDLKQDHSALDHFKKTVDKVLGKKNGHLDFFLRILLGLTVEHNTKFLQGLLTPLDPNQDTDKKLLTYLRSLRRKNLSPEKCISIFQTMVEMRDVKVKEEIEEYLTLSDQSRTELSPLLCSALAFMLLVSKNKLHEFNLRSYHTSGEGRRRLIPAVRCSKRALLKGCEVTGEWVAHLLPGLSSPFSPLRHLDLSMNDLGDSGVERLCDGLSNPCCKLETLRLSGCMVTELGCTHLVSALKGNPSHLKELDLSYNHPGHDGEMLLSEMRDNQEFRLETLNLDHCGEHRLRPGLKKYSYSFTLDPATAHRNLQLSRGNTRVMWVAEPQAYPPNPERFTDSLQVRSAQGVAESCFFKVWKEEPFSVGVSYRSISSRGDHQHRLGRHEHSWCMTCYDTHCYLQHGTEVIPANSACSRSCQTGVFVDWEGGEVSFYRVVDDRAALLHTFRERFTEPLYAVIELHPHTSATLQ